MDMCPPSQKRLSPEGFSEQRYCKPRLADRDGLFNSADLVRAFSDGVFERGMRSVQSAPEPNSFVQLVGLLVGLGLGSKVSRMIRTVLEK